MNTIHIIYACNMADFKAPTEVVAGRTRLEANRNFMSELRSIWVCFGQEDIDFYGTFDKFFDGYRQEHYEVPLEPGPGLFEMVSSFQEKFGFVKPEHPSRLGKKDYIFMSEHLQEEMEELDVATNLVDEFDALIDLVYIALGMAYRMGLPFTEGFRRVHEANMKKVRGMGKRGNPNDVVKPEDWQPAKLDDLV